MKTNFRLIFIGALVFHFIFLYSLPSLLAENPGIDNDQVSQDVIMMPSEGALVVFNGNSLFPISELPKWKTITRVKSMVTAYSSSPKETDQTPFVTASGTAVREGVVANNLLAFGTKIRLPEIFGDKVFVIEDRMSQKKGNYHFDIWFSSTFDALNFGAKLTPVEVVQEI